MNNRRLRVRIGPSADTLCTYNVNDDSRPQYVESPYFAGNVAVRVKDFVGHTPRTAADKPLRTTEYFGNRRRLFSIQVAGRFLQEYDGDDVLFGAVFESKVSPPTGSWIAMKVAAMIDPAMQSDLYGESPWFLSPMLCSMNACNVRPAELDSSKIRQMGAGRYAEGVKKFERIKGTRDGDAMCQYVPASSRENHRWVHHRHKSLHSYRLDGGTAGQEVLPELSLPLPIANELLRPSPDEIVGPWTWGGKAELMEHNLLLLDPQPDERHALSCESYGSVAERRKKFSKPTARKHYKFSPAMVYQFDMFAPFINMNSFDLSLGLSLNIFKTLNEQPIRLVAKSKSANVIFFMVEFALVKDDEHAQHSPKTAADDASLEFEDACE